MDSGPGFGALVIWQWGGKGNERGNERRWLLITSQYLGDTKSCPFLQVLISRSRVYVLPEQGLFFLVYTPVYPKCPEMGLVQSSHTMTTVGEEVKTPSWEMVFLVPGSLGPSS